LDIIGERIISDHTCSLIPSRLAAAKKKLRDTAKKKGQEIAEETLNKSAEALVNSYEQGKFDWTVLDITGITAVIDAFNKPICGS
jgi:hypothetical protein